MKRKITKSQSKEKVLKIIQSNGVLTRNRNVETTFRKYVRPNELKRSITNVEDSNWIAQHGNNYDLFQKEKSNRKSFRKLIVILGLLGFLFILAISIGLGCFFYYFFTTTITEVYLIPLNSSNLTTVASGR